MAHPDTYLNKVVVGSEEGRLQVRLLGFSQRLVRQQPAWRMRFTVGGPV